MLRAFGWLPRSETVPSAPAPLAPRPRAAANFLNSCLTKAGVVL